VAQYLKDAVSQAIQTDALSQYSPIFGLPRLRRAIANDYGTQLGRTIDPDSEVLVSQGATEGMHVFFVFFGPNYEFAQARWPSSCLSSTPATRSS